MKRLLLLFLVSALPCLAAYDKRLIHVLEQLREMPMVGGAAVGDRGSPHEFYLLLPYIIEVASDDDLRTMVRDQSPVVRIMAATCILRKEDKNLAIELDQLSKDETTVMIAPFGCSVFEQRVAEIVAEMKKDPWHFEGGKAPNQASEPTAASGRGSP